MRRIFVFLAVVAPLAVTLLCWKVEIVDFAYDFAGKAPTSQEFAITCLTGINDRRQQYGTTPLGFDDDIQSSLETFLASAKSASDIDLDKLLSYLQRSHPNITSLSATMVWHPASTRLANGVSNWEDGMVAEFDALSAVIFRDGYRRGCIGVLSHRLPHFNLTSANRDGGRYHHHCPRCGAGHAIELERSARTVQLRCPHCQRPYDILASDSQGKFHRAPSFLTGFSLPDSLAAKAGSDESRIAELWQLITSRCTYEADGADGSSGGYATPADGLSIPVPGANADSGAEAWQTPSETWQRKAGDCEDTSLLLADALISEGFDARVALGWNAQGGDHAWCVVHLDNGAQYILESTVTPHGPLRLLPVSEASAAYRPEQLFDRDHLYFPIGDQPANDYWSDDVWTSVPNNAVLQRTTSAMR